MFSRLGIARNDDTEALYDAAIRCFVPHVKPKIVNKIKDKTEESFENEPEHVRVLLARYSAFLVRRVSGPGGLSLIESEQRSDAHRAFIKPVRKLSSGEYLPGITSHLDYGHACVTALSAISTTTSPIIMHLSRLSQRLQQACRNV